jgi:acetate---CoA ligase (ADP-forming) subunit beta
MPTLSESSSKDLLRRHGFPLLDERIVDTAAAAVAAAREVDRGNGVVAKLCGDAIAHKTERGLVRLGLRGDQAVSEAAQSLLDAATADDGSVSVLIAPMVRGNRELIAGVADDAQFGKVVMIGIGGVLAEAIADVVFRLVPLQPLDAQEMIEDIGAQKLLGPFRGEPAVNRQQLVDTLLALSAVAQLPEVVSVDINPLIVVDGDPIAVDALVEVR